MSDQTYTAKDFEEVLRWYEVSCPNDRHEFVVVMTALHIAANVNRPGVIEGPLYQLYPKDEPNVIWVGERAKEIRAALTKEPQP
jgi:hypothetical protein